MSRREFIDLIASSVEIIKTIIATTSADKLSAFSKPSFVEIRPIRTTAELPMSLEK